MALEEAAQRFGKTAVGHLSGGAVAPGGCRVRASDSNRNHRGRDGLVLLSWKGWPREERGVILHEMRHIDASHPALQPLAPRQLHLFNAQVSGACRADGKVCGRG